MKPVYKRHFLYFLFLLASIIFFWEHLHTLTGLSMGGGPNSELYSHFLLIPFISGYLIWGMRKKIWEMVEYSLKRGLSIIVIGFLLYAFGMRNRSVLNNNDFLSFLMLGTVVEFIGGFILFYGWASFKRALFPLLFLLFMVPIPRFILDPYISVLQRASTEVSYSIFKILGIPVFRNGFVFELSGITIEVARECSGIRSSLALVITAVLAGYIFLETNWRRILLVLCSFPISVIKNAMRIVTLSLLASYVDRIFIVNHWLHRSGGFPFFIIGMLLLFLPLLFWLRRSEKKRKICKGVKTEVS